MSLTTEVYLCKNTKLFPGCTDNYYFANESARKSFFQGKSAAGLHFTALSYQRETRAMRLPVALMHAEECDYLMFNNPAYENKWIYAFIEKCIYINDEVTEVRFIVDPVQTWLPSCTLAPSEILSETVAVDSKFSEIMNIADYISGTFKPHAKGTLTAASDYATEYVCITSNALICPDKNSSHYDGTKWQAHFSTEYGNNCGKGDTLCYYVFKLSALTNADFISKALGAMASEAISGTLFAAKYKVLNICMVPAICLPAGAVAHLESADKTNIACICPDPDRFNDQIDSTAGGDPISLNDCWTSLYTYGSVDGSFEAYSYNASPRVTEAILSLDTASVGIFGGYTPKNNKLYSAPYCKLRILNNMGDAIDLWPQYFTNFSTAPFDFNFRFAIYGILGESPDVVLYPKAYLKSGSNTINPEYRLSMAPFPNLPYNENKFAEWLQQNSISNALRVGKGVMELAVGNIPGAISTGANMLSEVNNVTSQGISTNLPSNTGAVATALELHAFKWEYLSLQYYDAVNVDNHFKKYGYKVSIFSTPAFNSRVSFDYCQTSDAAFSSAPIPGDMQKELISLMDRGLRLWHGNYLGDYSRDNPIDT